MNSISISGIQKKFLDLLKEFMANLQSKARTKLTFGSIFIPKFLHSWASLSV